MSSTPQTIHHIVASSELVRGCSDDTYSPARLAADGFAHCSGSQAITLVVAADYYSDVQESLWVLEIDPTKLESELRFEAAARTRDVWLLTAYSADHAG